MKGYGPETFGTLNAENYDEFHDPGTTDQAVEVLAELAGSGKVLELAIGTGRIALPLAERGIAIEGIDASSDMVDQLRKKPGGDRIPVVIGDMADVPVDGTYDFVFLIFNTLFNLTSQDRQVDCFLNVGRSLNEEGVFLVETFVADLTRFTNGKCLQPRHIGFDTLSFEAAMHDPVTQVIEHQRVRIDANGVSMTPLPMRYAWPSEIDLMARLAAWSLRNAGVDGIALPSLRRAICIYRFIENRAARRLPAQEVSTLAASERVTRRRSARAARSSSSTRD